MGFRRLVVPVFARAVALGGALSLAVADVSPAATPYQATRTEQFHDAVQVEGHPTAFMAFGYGAKWSVADAAQAAKLCDRAGFQKALSDLERERKGLDKVYHDTLERLAHIDEQIDRLRELENEQWSAAEGSPTGSEARDAWFKTHEQFEGALVFRQNGARDAEEALQDANTIATVIIWVKQMKMNCPEPKPRSASVPLSPPPPPISPPSEALAPSCASQERYIEEINAARTNPGGYLRDWPDADVETRDFMHLQPPAPPLTPSPALEHAAERHAKDQGGIGLNGHVGTDGSKPMQRIHDAGLFSSITAEVIAVSQPTPRAAIHQLILDRGNPGHPHRADLFNASFTLAGAACARDVKFGEITVIDLSSPPIPR